MKTALLALLFFGAAAFATDPQTAGNPSANAQQVKRLGSVTWDLDAHKLVWVVQKGTMVDDEFVPASEERYEISPDEATMATAGETRGFSGQEAVSLHKLLDTLSLYCAESVVWWDQGQGTPVDPDTAEPSGRPGRHPKTKGGEKPVKVEDSQPAKPAYKVPDTDFVAALTHRL